VLLPTPPPIVDEELTVLLSDLKVEEDCLDFDPFYETQKAFEKIIQEEVSNYGNLQNRTIILFYFFKNFI